MSSATNGEFNPDRIIRELAGKGYAIVSVRCEPTARRGNAKPPPYTGPAMLGQSHSSRLINGTPEYVVPASASHGPR